MIASLGCGNTEYPVYDTGSSSWGCTTITDSTLTETEVDNFVDNNGYLTLGDLASVACAWVCLRWLLRSPCSSPDSYTNGFANILEANFTNGDLSVSNNGTDIINAVISVQE